MPSIKYLADLDLSGGQLLNTRLQHLATPPTAESGRVYFDTSLTPPRARYHNGSEWVDLVDDGGDADTLEGQPGEHYLSRENHTGTQTISTVLGLQGELDGKASDVDLSAHTGDTDNPHEVTATQIGAVPTSEKGSAGGVAELDGNGLVPKEQVPPIAIGETFSASSEAEMLALDAHMGDVAVRSDTDSKWLLVSDDPSSIESWHELGSSVDVVESVSGGSGIDTSGTSNVTVSLNSATQSTLAEVGDKADQSALDAHTGDSNNPHGVTAAQVGATRKFSTEIVDPGVSEVVNHGLGTQDVLVQIYFDGELVHTSVEIVDANNVALGLSYAQNGSLRVVVIG
jgi:hypothetical protein